jgi:hypothetical protein
MIFVDLVFRTRAYSEKDRYHALRELRYLGMEIIGPESTIGVTVAAPPERVRALFGEVELSVPHRLQEWFEAARLPPRGRLLDEEEEPPRSGECG